MKNQPASQSATQRVAATEGRGYSRQLARLTKICLALPETTRECHGSHASFHVGKKIFAYFLNDHHGDGMVAVTCKVLPGDNNALAARDPGRFYLPAYLASRGWVALRLDLGNVDWDEAAELAVTSYRLIAPKRLAAAAKKPRA
ncbi:MAG TPA: MmcQ/YjbR family DNA-binding protein [Candidatus Acidoferrales bacterium]|jgi:predicted DNA-binding protein (MmcQ/YjbR family)|nr:MmcQ/YjbR family DNA-binding protein [Candidatus Acidoferrales bacterium]